MGELKESPAQLSIESENELEKRFSQEVVSSLTNEFLETGTGIDLKEKAAGKQFVVALIPANGRYADIGRSVETPVFADAFQQSLSEINEDYSKYDDASTFITVIDISSDKPRPAGVIRMIDYDPKVGHKDINDLVYDGKESPWLDDIKANYFTEDEDYDPELAWERLGDRKGVSLKPEESFDVATIAVDKAYRGQHGDLDSVSILLYHSCLRYALAHGKKNLLSIQDLKPLGNLQQYGDPFDVFEDLPPRPYGGPFDTIPAYCVLDEGMQRIRDKDELIGKVFIDGFSLNDNALLLEDYMPDEYSNPAVGLPRIDQDA